MPHAYVDPWPCWTTVVFVSMLKSDINYVKWQVSNFKNDKFLYWSLGHAEQFLCTCLCSKVTVYRWKWQCFFGDLLRSHSCDSCLGRIGLINLVISLSARIFSGFFFCRNQSLIIQAESRAPRKPMAHPVPMMQVVLGWDGFLMCFLLIDTFGPEWLQEAVSDNSHE